MAINVVYSADANYKEIMGISLTSLLTHASQRVDVYIIGWELGNVSAFRQFEKDYNCSLTFIDFSNFEKQLVLSENLWNLSKSSYARLLLTEMLPAGVDRCIYIDSDTIINDDFSEYYWDSDLENYMAEGVIDTASDDTKEKTGIPTNALYFNAGILLVNLKLWRERKVIQDFFHYISDCNGAVFHHDQGVINHCLCGQIKPLPPRVNAMSPYFMILRLYHLVPEKYYSPVEIEEAKSYPIIIHYTEALTTRPWYKNCAHPMREQFINNQRRSYWPEFEYKKDTRAWKMKMIDMLYRTFPFSFANTLINAVSLAKRKLKRL